jgi:2-polyprenyl-6-hydroxyphenyl methylase/3-demethylubiquinone-9 3-methyltransferase
MSTTPLSAHDADSGSEPFAFGRNWRRFLDTVDERRIGAAVQSLQSLLATSELRGRRFLDAGCGSGLFSLAARRLGAKVCSFDRDPQCVACALELQRRFAPGDAHWTIGPGSLLDASFLRGLGEFDVVYCWGVAHHTGEMWRAIDNLQPHVGAGGTLVLAIYNDQLYISKAWCGVKRSYQRLPRWLQPALVVGVGAALFAKRLAVSALAGLLRCVTLRNPLTPFVNWYRESQARGMHAWFDLVDWVGGWPFEAARPEAVFRYLRDRGFQLRELTTSLGHGCNEFVFTRSAETSPECRPAR